MSSFSDQPPPADPADEESTAFLLRMAGPRPPVPGTRAARVHTAVRGHWHASARRRAARGRALVAAVILPTAATLVWVIGRLVIAGGTPIPAGDPVAVVERVDGAVAGLQPGDSIRTGEWIETAPRARLAIRVAAGTAVRFDVASRARLISANAMELSAGAVYIDTGSAAGRFEVRTPMGTARDVGTQFEVRIQPNAVRVRVRSGMVELLEGARSVAADAGTEVTLSATGAVSRPIAAHDAAWGWTASLAPTLDIEGVALSEFLDRTSQELGWRVQYSEPALAREAASTILHGSVAGLQPRDAIEVAITTSGLTYRVDEGALVVTKRPASR